MPLDLVWVWRGDDLWQAASGHYARSVAVLLGERINHADDTPLRRRGLSAGGIRGAKPRSEPLEAVAAAPQTLAMGQIIDFTDAEHAERPVPLRCPSWSVRDSRIQRQPDPRGPTRPERW